MQTISVSEAAKRLNVSYHTVKKWIDLSILPTKVFPGGRLRIAVDELERFYNSLPDASAKREVLESCEIRKANR